MLVTKPECEHYVPRSPVFAKYIKECSTCKFGDLCMDFESISRGSYGTSYYRCLEGFDNTLICCPSPNFKRTYMVDGQSVSMFPEEYEAQKNNNNGG